MICKSRIHDVRLISYKYEYIRVALRFEAHVGMSGDRTSPDDLVENEEETSNTQNENLSSLSSTLLPYHPSILTRGARLVCVYYQVGINISKLRVYAREVSCRR